MRRENRTNYSRFLPEDQMMGQDYYYPEDYPPPPAIYGAPPLMNPSSLPPIPPQSYQPHYTQPKNSWTAQQRSASNNINNSGNNKSRSTLASTYRPPASEGTRQASSWVPADRHSGGDLYRKETYRSSERAVGGSFYRPESTEETRDLQLLGQVAMIYMVMLEPVVSAPSESFYTIRSVVLTVAVKKASHQRRSRNLNHVRYLLVLLLIEFIL
ncbi:unnamed protein product [Ambrosiozyma monospora]|uniref:Unnamed protein product n=1 Tax=Ambrosiozyma monospora TaxID=43982 RepID=A0ACB5TPQ7_AMBMO|nr:unnamed protein product [Ambrosiozyma monospora]